MGYPKYVLQVNDFKYDKYKSYIINFRFGGDNISGSLTTSKIMTYL